MPVAVQDLLDQVNLYDLDFETQESFTETRDQFIDLQQKQLFSGVDESGDKILPEYTARTVAIKKKKGQPTDRVTLKDTGAFYSEMFLDPREDIYVIDSADEKSGDLQKKYGPEIFGLTEQNQTQYVEENLEPVFLDRTRKALQL